MTKRESLRLILQTFHFCFFVEMTCTQRYLRLFQKLFFFLFFFLNATVCCLGYFLCGVCYPLQFYSPFFVLVLHFEGGFFFGILSREGFVNFCLNENNSNEEL